MFESQAFAHDVGQGFKPYYTRWITD